MKDHLMTLLEAARPIRQRTTPGDVLTFLDIPGTGGATLFPQLAARFAADQVFSSDDEDPEDFLRALREGARWQTRLIRTTCDYSIYRFFPRKPVFLTLLREPLQRTLSAYGRASALEDPRGDGGLVAEGLADFLQDPRHRDLVENVQIRHLVGWRHPGFPRLSPQDQLAIARRRLGELAWFGLAEQMDASADLLAYSLGWEAWEEAPAPLPDEHARLIEVDGQVRRLLEEKNDLDRELYVIAREVFHQRHRGMVREASILAARLGWTRIEEVLRDVPPDLDLAPAPIPFISRPTPGPSLRLSKWIFRPVGRLRRWVIPEESAGEGRYLTIRKRILGW